MIVFTFIGFLLLLIGCVMMVMCPKSKGVVNDAVMNKALSLQFLGIGLIWGGYYL